MEEYQVGGEICTSKIKWAEIDEVRPEEKMLWVTDEDGEVYDVYYEQIINYFPPRG